MNWGGLKRGPGWTSPCRGRRAWLPIVLALQVTAGALADDTPVAAPLNPEFVAWRIRCEATAGSGSSLQGRDGSHGLGCIPSPVDRSRIRGPVFPSKIQPLMFPRTYDLRLLGQVTPVRNQGATGTCWAHATLASLESSLLKAGRDTFSFSPWHLAWYTYNDFPDVAHPQMVSFTKRALQPGEDPTFDQGGTESKAVAILARGTGPVDESDCPFGGRPPTGDEPVSVPLRQAFFLGSKNTSTDMKTAIVNFGAVTLSFNWNSASFGYWPPTYRDVLSTASNHMVAVVGWDDDYPAALFPPGNQPATNGVWIVKNSWGETWGDGGYFYMSYDSFVDRGTVLVSDQDTYVRVYQHDPLGWVTSLGYPGSSTAWFSNVFTAQGNDRLEAVSFYVPVANASYVISVRRGVTTHPSTGVPAGAVQSGTLDAPGYRKVVLTTPVLMLTGERFAVTVKLTTPGYEYPVPIELPVTGYSSKATSNPGESYLSATGNEWLDLSRGAFANSSACLKVFAGSFRVGDLEAPSSLAISGGRAILAVLTWVDNSRDEEGFSIERRRAGADAFEVVGTVPASTTTWTDTNMSPHATYAYRVRAFNRAGVSAYSETVTVHAVSTMVTPLSATPESSTGSGNGSGHCFIATAAYGSPLDPHVKVLRRFRDRVLLTNDAGRLFVSTYYRYSPPIADQVRRSETLRSVTRWALARLIHAIESIDPEAPALASTKSSRGAVRSR